jgi:hypothetical protein
MTRPRVDLEFTAFYPETRSVVIPAGGSLSDPVDLDGVKLLGIQMPSAWDAANLTFQVSANGVAYADLYNQAGSEVVVNAAAGRFIALDPALFAGIRFLRIRSGTAETPINQTAARTLLLVARAVY